jgi:ABC-type multidrug transport system ATPase subunit/ABC-type multidrug transport system permease subunit
MQEGAYTDDPSSGDWTPLIAAIPLLALFATACVFSFYLLTNRAFFKGAPFKTAGKDNGDDDTALDGAVAAANIAAATAAAGAASSTPVVDPVREIAFSDINKIVPIRGGESRAILSHVSGVARMGELVGVLGPSGGGKTSLLSVLAGSVEDSGRNAIITGSVTLDGRPLDASLARRVAYCAQDCTLLPTLSVEECVRYSALLRLPRGTSAPEVATVVSNVITELGLTKVAGSLVGGGSGIRGVSGGERRRITIAMELVINPAILVLDEPTSGLDSFTAYNMMSTLKSVANSGRIVMLSFHQPSPAMFNLLDRCFLMAQGRCVFSGAPKGVEAHFAGIGLPVPAGVGAAEHMLHCACDPASLPTLLSSTDPLSPSGNNTHANEDASKSLGLASNSTSEDAEAGVIINGTSTTTTSPAIATTSTTGPAAGAGITRQLAVLFWRALMDIIRNPTLLLLHWVMGLIMGLFGGCIFFGVGTDISGAQDRLGAVFFSLAFFAFTSLTTVDLIMNERRIVSREVRGGYYSPAAYYVTKAVLDALLLRAIPVLLYSAPFYPMMGFVGGANHVGLFLMVLATFAVVIGALSLAVAVGCSTPGQASLVMNIILLISLLVGGFFVNAASMPVWISWLRFISAFFYAYASLTINEFSSLLLNFEVEGYTAVQNVRGTTFLDIVGVNYNRLTDYVIILDCMYVIFLLLGFALLYWRMPRARRLKKKKAAAAAEVIKN